MSRVQLCRLTRVVHLSRGDGLALALSALAGGKAGLKSRRTLGDGLLGLSEDHLNVAGVGHVRVDLGRK